MSFLTWVQLIRNALCVTKTFSASTVSYMQAAFPKAAFPINQISFIEFAIALSQYTPVVLLIISSYTSFIAGFRDSYRSKKLLVGLDKLSLQGGSIGNAEFTILRQQILLEKDNGYLKQITGCWEFIIGCCFVFLGNHSLHLHGPTHPLPLIRALLIMEIALLYFLYIMWKNILENIKLLFKINNFHTNLKTLIKKLKDEKSPKLPDYSEYRLLQLASEVGYLDNLMEVYKILDHSFIGSYHHGVSTLEGLRQDLSSINDFLSTNRHMSPTANTVKDAPKVKDDRMNALLSYQDRLEQRKKDAKLEIFNGVVIFLLNIIAFYGYLMCVLAFYYPNASTSDDASFMEYFTKLYCFNMALPNADFYGALAGDLAWAIEPAYVLFVIPLLKARSIPTKARSYPTDEKEKTN